MVEIATHVVLFMADGICSHLHYSLGHFATDEFDSHQLFSTAWEAAKLLEASYVTSNRPTIAIPSNQLQDT